MKSLCAATLLTLALAIIIVPGVFAGKPSLVYDSSKQSVTLLSTSTGALMLVLDSTDVPGGMIPGAIAARGSWAAIADSKNDRLIRLRFSAN